MASIQQTRQPEKPKERPSALRSIIAGSTAGAVEIGLVFTTVTLFSLNTFLLTNS